MWKILVLAVAMLMFSACSLSDNPANREKEADRFMQAFPPSELIDDMVKGLAENVPPEQRDSFAAMFATSLDMKVIGKSMREAMVKDFTAPELKSLADFYTSPISRSAMKKYGTYMSDIMPVIQQEMVSGMQKLMPKEGAPDRPDRD